MLKFKVGYAEVKEDGTVELPEGYVIPIGVITEGEFGDYKEGDASGEREYHYVRKVVYLKPVKD